MSAQQVAARALAEGGWRLSPIHFATKASAGAFLPYHWLRVVSRAVYDCVTTPGGRLLVNAPYRHGKSEFISYWVPTWYLENRPHLSVIMCAYGSDLAYDFGRKVRDEFAGNPLLRNRLREDSQAVGRWHTTHGGGMICAGVGGPITGRGGNLLILDDPYKNWQDANSPRVRSSVEEWFRSTFWSRREPGASVIVTMTRWHEDDLSEFLINRQGVEWDVLSLPALADAADDPTGREIGEALCPQRFSAEDLDENRRAMGKIAWAALGQQKPLELSGGRVYDNYRRERHLKPTSFDPAGWLGLALDFNISPGMHGLVFQHDDRRDFFSFLSEIHGPRLAVTGLMERFIEWYGRLGSRPVVHVFGDATGDSQWAGTAESCYTIVFRALRQAGIPWKRRVPRNNPPVRSSIDAVQDALFDLDGVVHVAIPEDCPLLHRDLRELKPGDVELIDKKDRRLSHPSDCMRYAISYLRPIRLPSDVTAGRFSVSVGA